MAILSAMALNFSSVFRNEEIQSTRVIGSLVLLTADAVLWAGAATMLILGMALFAASRAAFTVVTFRVSSRSDGVSWVIRVRISTED